MGDAFITRRGGGIKEGYALIAVTFPTGSVCTCTNGSKTLRAKDTGGAFLFAIPEAGTWVVSCTDGTKTSTKSVVIDSQYQTESILLAYELVLYDGSLSTPELRECTAVTGGWHGTKQGTYYGDGEFHSESNQIRLYRASGKAITAEPLNAIDLTNYSTFKVYVNQQSGNLALNVRATSPVGFDNPRTEITSTGWWTFDISSYTGDYYLGISVWGDGSASTNCFNKVVLE